MFLLRAIHALTELCFVSTSTPARRSRCRRSNRRTRHRFRSWQKGELLEQTASAHACPNEIGVCVFHSSSFLCLDANQDSSVCPEEGRLPDAKQGCWLINKPITGISFGTTLLTEFSIVSF
jgi:hypothetical protein